MNNATIDRNRTATPLSSSTITGTSVVNRAGENLGSIKDLMIDTASGSVRYAVLDFGGVLGVGNKLFAVPFDAFQADTDDERFILEVDKDVLKNAEGFDQDDWPDFADRQLEQKLHDFYGVSPYWNR